MQIFKNLFSVTNIKKFKVQQILKWAKNICQTRLKFTVTKIGQSFAKNEMYSQLPKYIYHKKQRSASHFHDMRHFLRQPAMKK